MNPALSDRKLEGPFDNVVVTAGVAQACCEYPKFPGFISRSLSAFSTVSGPRLFCRFHEGDLGISVVRDPVMGMTTVAMDAEY